MILHLEIGPNHPIEWKGNNNSQVWSMTKKKWMKGPTLMKGYYALNTCALALNSSAVLIVGLIEAIDFSASYPWDKDGLIPNTATAIYNFQTKSWSLQEPIDYNTGWNKPQPFEYIYSYTCQIIPDKKWNKYKYKI